MNIKCRVNSVMFFRFFFFVTEFDTNFFDHFSSNIRKKTTNHEIFPLVVNNVCEYKLNLLQKPRKIQS